MEIDLPLYWGTTIFNLVDPLIYVLQNSCWTKSNLLDLMINLSYVNDKDNCIDNIVRYANALWLVDISCTTKILGSLES